MTVHDHSIHYITGQLDTANVQSGLKPATQNNDREKDSTNAVGPFYPTIDGKPPKVSPEKPQKKVNKENNIISDNVKYTQPQPPYSPINNNANSYEITNYNEDENVKGNHPQGPGFFNPAITKTQFQPYNPYQGQNNIQEKPIQHELYSILGPNSPQNVPPHVRIEHLLQHLQTGSDPSQGTAVVHIPITGSGSAPPPPGSPPSQNFPFGGFPVHQLPTDQGLAQRPQTG